MWSTPGHGGSVEEALRALADRCETSYPPTSYEVEVALERGFAAVISLEAQLQRLDRGGPSAASAHARPSRELLQRRIGSLRGALQQLRERATPEVSSSLALGFVFPRVP
jgi:hypothetical protein